MIIKSYATIFLSLILFACKSSLDNKEVVEQQSIENAATISGAEKEFPEVEIRDSEIEEAAGEEEIHEDKKNDFDILIPTQYRDWEDKNVVSDLTTDWIDLYQKKGKYYLGKANYELERGYSECSGDSTKIINSKNKTLLLLDNPKLKLGEISALKIKKNKVWPEENLTFHFGTDQYTLHATGNVLSSEQVYTDQGKELYQKVENYKLYLSVNNSTKTLILKQESFNDTFVEILFVGDLDQDGKLDFIFGANRDYEEQRVILYLSAKAKKGKPLQRVSEVAVQFDC